MVCLLQSTHSSGILLPKNCGMGISFSISTPPLPPAASALGKCLMGKMIMYLGLFWISSVMPTHVTIKSWADFSRH